MTPEQWQQVNHLFAECLDTPPRRLDELFDERNVQPEVRREVYRLLRSTEKIEISFPLSSHPVPENTHRLEAGDFLANRFRIVRFLGHGGVGEVYEARDEDVGEVLALKLVRPAYHDSAEVSARLRRELQLARRVAHPNVCRLFDLNRHEFSWGESQFLTMELLQGVTLSRLMKEHGPYSSAECLPYLRQILAGLQAAHDAGIVHRDLKPANIMVTPTQEGLPRCVLMDFGLARQHIFPDLNETLTGSREILGTLAYMAPEQLAGEQVTARTDLYAFGIIMFELLHGYRPYQSIRKDGKSDKDATDAAGDKMIVQQRQELTQRIPKAWNRIIERCLSADASRRPGSVSEIITILEEKPLMSRRAMLVTGVSAGVSVLIGGTGYIYWRDSGPDFAPGSSLLVTGPITLEGDPVGVQVRESLKQSNRLALWDNNRFNDVWSRMGREGPPAPSTRDWREIALRESVEFVLFPSVSQVGDGTSLSLRLEQIRNNPDTVVKAWQKSFEAVDKEHLFEAVDSGNRWMRGLIGESARDIDNSTAKPQVVTTPSWEALKEFSRGESLMGQRDQEGAVLAFLSATRLDPLFTMAWMRLGDVQVQLGRDNDAFTAWQRAEEVSRQRPLTKKEDLRFRGMFASDSQNYAVADQTFKDFTYNFPNEWYGRFYRALPLLMMGHVSESIGEMEKCLSFPKVEAAACLQLVTHYLYAGDRKSAASMVDRLKKLGSDARAAYSEALIAHEGGNTEGALDALTRTATDSVLMPRSRETLAKSIVLADAGMVGPAIDMLRTGAREDDQKGERERWASKLISMATLMDMVGNRAEATEAIQPLKRVEVGPMHTGAAGVLFARFGDRVQAERLLAEIANLGYPRFQSPRLHVQAELQFAAKNIADGLRLARQAASIEPRAFGSEYLAGSLDRFASKQEALAEYKDCLKAKCFQLFLSTPAPAGSWLRTSSAVKRLESSL